MKNTNSKGNIIVYSPTENKLSFTHLQGSKMSSTDLLFVYGTLKKGFQNQFAVELSAHAIFEGTGNFPGELYLCGWFPAAISLPESPFRVHGEIYKLKDLKRILALLDDYEEITGNPTSSLYVREIIQVQNHENRQVSCYVYIYNQSISNLPRIYEGNFIKQESDSEEK